MNIENYFTPENKLQIANAIRVAEMNTSGEIRLHIEKYCKVNVLDRATYVFEKLEMHKTQLRNGVLFYLAVEDHKFAILGDAGINQKVTVDFWEKTKELVLSKFKMGNITEGLTNGILMAGEQLKEHFPYLTEDKNELTNDISFGGN